MPSAFGVKSPATVATSSISSTYLSAASATFIASSDSSSHDLQEEGPAWSGFPAAIKAAICICSALGFLFIAGLILYLLNRRRKESRRLRTSVRHKINNDNGLVQRSADSPAPLIPPISSIKQRHMGPLTPPPRLRERRLLPILLTPIRSSQVNRINGSHGMLWPSENSATFPISPICAPTTSKLVPRHERVPKIYGESRTPAGSQVGATVPKPASFSSFGSNLVNTNSGSSTIAPSFTGGATPPSSPTRSARPQDAPVEGNGLSKPGPPPARALPATPPNPPPSERRNASSTGNTTGAVTLEQESKDLCEHTEECARGVRESWGSWSGTGGGGPGVSVSSPRNIRNSSGICTPVIGEDDLEKLAGRY
jgi:hypothetical protein